MIPRLATVKGVPSHDDLALNFLTIWPSHAEPTPLQESNASLAPSVSQSDIWLCFRMSDLAAPFLTIFEDDAMAFWCFERLLQRTSKNFRHDEVGMRCAYCATMQHSHQQSHQSPHRLVHWGSEVCNICLQGAAAGTGQSTGAGRPGRVPSSAPDWGGGVLLCISDGHCSAAPRATPGPGRPLTSLMR